MINYSGLSWTQLCVLKVIRERGKGTCTYADVSAEVRERSGRTVRPNATTYQTLAKLGLITDGPQLTSDGRELLRRHDARVRAKYSDSRNGETSNG